MIKSCRRPDYTKHAYGLCVCICLPYKVSNQIKILTELAHTHSDCHLSVNVWFCSATPTFRQHIFWHYRHRIYHACYFTTTAIAKVT